MATGGLYTKIFDIITCEICFEDFRTKTPRALSCLHVFCEQCIQTLIDTTAKRSSYYDNTVTCPTCKVGTKIPSRQAASLPIFFYSRQLEDIAKEVEQRHSVCHLCETDMHISEVSSYCFQCAKAMCVKCRQKHDRMIEDHKCIGVTMEKIQNLICSRHEAYMEYLCTSCARSLCRWCYFTDHSDHQVYTVTYDSPQTTPSVKDWLEKKLCEAKQSRINLDHIQILVDTNIGDTRNELKHHHEALKEKIDEQFNSLSEDLDKIHQELNEDLRKAKYLADEACGHIQRFMNENRHLDEPIPGVPEGKILNWQQLISDIESKLPQCDITVKKSPEVVFVPNPQTITVGRLTRQGKLLRCEDTNLTLTQTLDPGVGDICDVCCLDSGDLVVIGEDGLVVFNKDGLIKEHHLTKVHGEDRWLEGVCVDHVDGSVYITEYKGSHTPGCLHVYKPEGGQWNENKVSVCERPLCVALCTDKRVLISDCDRGLHKYDICECGRGRSIWCVQMSDKVSSVAVTSDDTIVVCVYKKDVLLLDTNGQTLSTIGSPQTQIEPICLCLGTHDDILVYGNKSESLLLYSKNGQFIRNVINPLSSNIQHIKLLKAGSIAMCDWDRVFVYKM